MSRSFPSSRGRSTCPWYTVGGMSDKNLEQRINIKFCVKIGKSAGESLALLTVAYGEYVMKKSSVFEWHRLYAVMCLERLKKNCDESQSRKSGVWARIRSSFVACRPKKKQYGSLCLCCFPRDEKCLLC